MRLLDNLLGGFRPWRRLRGGRWIDALHLPTACGGWFRADTPLSGEIVMRAEDYRLPRARALP